MLDCSPANLHREISAAYQMQKPRVEAARKSIRELASSRNQGQSGSDITCPDNPAYEYLGLFEPSVSFSNPRVACNSRRPGVQGDIAKAIRIGLNRWAKDTDYVQHLGMMARSMAFLRGASVVRQWKMDGYAKQDESTPSWPRVEAVPFAQFLKDPLAQHWSHGGRWSAHCTFWDKEDLIERSKDPKSGWIRGVVEDAGTGSAAKDIRGFGEKDKVPDRKEIACWEIWVGEHELDESKGRNEGFNGTIFTITASPQSMAEDGEKAEWIREPRPYYGPRWGPHTVYGAYSEPESPNPLAPLAVVGAAMAEQNAHARAVSIAALGYKRILFVDQTNAKVIDAMKNAPDMFIYPCTMPNKSEIVVVEVGGVTQQMMQHYGITQERTDRLLAMHDAQRGIATGDATATANSIASDASTKRMAYLKQQFTRSACDELATVAWYLYHDDRVIFPVGGDDSAGPGMHDPHFMGGHTDENPVAASLMKNGGSKVKGSGATFDDLELEIQPHSTEYTSEASIQQRAMQEITLLGQIAPMVVQMPWVKWRDELARLGDAFNNPALADAIDWNMAAQIAKQQAQAAAQQPILATQAGSAGGSANPNVGQGIGLGRLQPQPTTPGSGPGPARTAQANAASAMKPPSGPKTEAVRRR